MEDVEFCKETVDLWLDSFKKRLAENHANIDEEIEEVKGTISNENVWLNGSFTEEERECHSQNIATLTAYLCSLEELKDEQ